MQTSFTSQQKLHLLDCISKSFESLNDHAPLIGKPVAPPEVEGHNADDDENQRVACDDGVDSGGHTGYAGSAGTEGEEVGVVFLPDVDDGSDCTAVQGADGH